MSDKCEMSLDAIIMANNRRNGCDCKRRRGVQWRLEQGFRERENRRDRNDRGGSQWRRQQGSKISWRHVLSNSLNDAKSFKGYTKNNEPPATLFVSNLDYRVGDNDLRELFQDFGPLKGIAIHYNNLGEALGSAQVDFESEENATEALNKYNGVRLHGRLMNIQIAQVQERNPAISISTTNRLRQIKKSSVKELDVEIDRYNAARRKYD